MTLIDWSCLVNTGTNKQTNKEASKDTNQSVKARQCLLSVWILQQHSNPSFRISLPKSSDMGEAGFAACLVELYICFVCCHLLRKLRMENLYHKLYIQDRQA